MSGWEGLLNLVEGDPFSWMLRFQGKGIIELEYFSYDYSGDLEAGCGDWSHEGNLEEVVRAAESFLLSDLYLSKEVWSR